MIKGIRNGAVLQRDENDLCKVYLNIADKEPKCSMGTLTHIKDDVWCFSGIKAGGPYSFEICGETFTDIYIGDVWLLGGQSNMEGAGVVTDVEREMEKHSDPEVRVFFSDNTWRNAMPVLHQPWYAVENFLKDKWVNDRLTSIWKNAEIPNPPFDGVGPGFAFANKMKEITEVPQAVIPCAAGGTSMDEWSPEFKTGDHYYAIMLRRFKECGSNVRGMYWDQGEAEADKIKAQLYTQRMITLISELRKDTKIPNMPVVINQIALTHLPQIQSSEEQNNLWSYIRNEQYHLREKIENLDMVATISAELDDLIHKSSKSQHIIGKDAALAMGNLCGYDTMPSIRFNRIEAYQDVNKPFWYNLRVYFDNVIGELTSNGYCFGFSICYGDDKPPVFMTNSWIQHMKAKENYVEIHLEATYETLKTGTLWYGLGNNCNCTIIDSEGRSIPAFGPIKVSNYMK